MATRRARPVLAWFLSGPFLPEVVWFYSEFPLPGLPSEGRATGHDPGFFMASESEKGCLARFEGPRPVRAQAILVV